MQRHARPAGIGENALDTLVHEGFDQDFGTVVSLNRVEVLAGLVWGRGSRDFSLQDDLFGTRQRPLALGKGRRRRPFSLSHH